MKVVFLKDVPRVGRRYDVKEVSDGYAANFLFPRRLAEAATDAKVRELTRVREAREGERAAEQNLLTQELRALDGKRFTLRAKANEKGHLFVGVHADQVAEAVRAAKHSLIGAENVVLPHPLKEVGEHEVSIKAGESAATITLVIEAQ